MLKYFSSRAAAGQQLADQLLEYQSRDNIVVALNDAGVIVGEPIAAQLNCQLSLLLIENIEIPGEPEPFGTVNQEGRLTYNSRYTSGEIEGWYSEFRGSFEEQQRVKFQKINHLLCKGGILNIGMMKNKVVILVADGLLTGASLDAAMDFLKPVRVQRIIIAVPLATVSAVDKMHILADELHVLGVSDNLLEIKHYYDEKELPSHEATIAKINQAIFGPS